jgi:DNA-binding XRE family transcriptional regulator
VIAAAFRCQQNGVTRPHRVCLAARMGEIVPLRRTPLPPAPTEASEPLWRELVGDEIRRTRQDRGERLVDVAERAGVSPQYLSEVERGLNDPSSEMLAAVAGALDLTVRELSTIAATGSASSGGALCLAA